MKKIILSGHLDVPATALEAVRLELPHHIAATLQEEGCIAFDVTEAVERVGRFNVYEEFISREALEYHQQRVGRSRWGEVSATAQRYYAIEEVESEHDERSKQHSLVRVRPYQDADRDALVRLWSEVFPDDPAHNDPARVIAAKLDVDDMIFVAESNGDLIGACIAGYDGHRGWLYAVAVRDSRRRSGTGSALVHHAIRALEARGCIKVNLQIRAGNDAVVGFYKSLGFTVEDRISMGALLRPLSQDAISD